VGGPPPSGAVQGLDRPRRDDESVTRPWNDGDVVARRHMSGVRAGRLV